MSSIIENNKFIDQFMGDWLLGRGFSYEEMNYNTDYGTLMPVVEKIESLNYDFNIHGGCCVTIVDIDPDREQSRLIVENSVPTKLLTIYNAVVEFIKYYNTLNK